MKKLLLFIIFLTTCCILTKGQNGIPSVTQIRQGISNDIKSLNISAEPIYKIENRTIWTDTDSIKIRIYYPNAGSNNRIIYNIHGGALVACDLDTHDNISRVLAKSTNSVVVAIDYRKPPEFPYPASIIDCEKILSWIKQNASSINGNSKNIILLGESAGGLLIASLAVKLRDGLGVKGICLINPATDLRQTDNPLYKLVTKWYLNGKDPNDPMISPILADNFSYYPKSLIITCEKDELKSQGTSLFEKLKKEGKDVEFLDIEKEDHLAGFWAANHPLAKKAVDRTILFIKSFNE